MFGRASPTFFYLCPKLSELYTIIFFSEQLSLSLSLSKLRRIKKKEGKFVAGEFIELKSS